MRSLPLGVQSFIGVRAGLSGVLDLSAAGPIAGNGEVAMRIMPLERNPGFDHAFGLLRGVVLEDLAGLRWQEAQETQRRPGVAWTRAAVPGHPYAAEVYLSPNPMGVVPLPYGRAFLEPPEGEQLRSGPGASVRWSLPVRRILDLKLGLEPEDLEPDRFPEGDRYRRLTHPGQGTDSALRWSLRVAGGNLPPRQLAARLARALQGFRYTLDNPSGGAANPLEDFLERSHAGHCEFFASALAIMLRRRGVPARVVNGYRLGTWIEEGGYYLVTQNEAHSWVEYYDPEARGWRTADPTPPAPPSSLRTSSFMAALERLTDTVRFKWDRDVVRFSDEDQAAGVDWLHAKAWALGAAWTRLRAALGAVALLAGLTAVAWFLRSLGALRFAGVPGGPGHLPQLRPLLKAAPRVPPRPGETARAWLTRLGSARPDREAPLEALAREADAVAYGGRPGPALARLAREEARTWTRKK
jgi:transglutaminase-like putative cysteine protease